MILDWYNTYDNDDDRPSLYLRMRGEDGILQERHIHPNDEDYQSPFCWVRQDADEWRIKQILKRYPGSSLHKDITAKGIDKKLLWKLEVMKPDDLWDIKNDYKGLTYEADLQYIDQILLSLYPESIPIFKPRIWYFDLEWDTEEGFTTVMGVDDNYAEHPVVFTWKEGIEIQEVEWIDREDGYMRYIYGSEEEMHEAFLAYLNKCDPDILVAHWITGADLPHLYNRLSNPNRLSPIGKILRPNPKSGMYNSTIQPIKGRLIFDTAATWQDGSGFEGLWYKAGKGQAQSRKLDWWAKELGFDGKLTNEYPEMTVFNGWREHFDIFCDYCLRDSTLLRACDEKLNCIKLHLALQQLCGVAFSSTHKVSRYFRGLIGRRTELKAPSSISKERPKLEAGWVMSPIGGRYEDVGLFDFASLYPNIILSNNLCYTTKCDGPGENILSLGNGTHWRQDKKGLLPSVVEEMLKLRKYYKQQMKNATDDDEKLGYDMLQMAVKVSVNAIYGLTGMRSVGGMWVDYDIARSITYKGRESIHMLVAESEKQGYKALAGHTDSAYIQVPYDKAEWLAQHLTDIAQNKLDMKYLDVEWEAYFPYWFTAHETKNRNFGIKSYPPSEVGQMKVTGYEIKASYASQITKDIQGIAFNLICNGEEEDDVKSAIVPFVNNLYNGNISIIDITSHARIQMEFKDYVSPTAAVQAAMYYNKYHANKNDVIKKGESVKWVYVNGVPNGQSSVSFAAYKEEDDLDDYSIDWYTIIEKHVTAKLKSVYEALGWDLQAVVKDNRMKSYW